MKRYFIFPAIAILCASLLSCGKSSQKDCEMNNTGIILFHNTVNGFNPDSIHIFLGSADLGLVRLNGELSVDNQRPGMNLYTFTYQGAILYSDSISVTQCSTTHYTISWAFISDRRLKKNITPVNNVLNDISLLHIYSFEYEPAKGYTGFLPGGTHYGFMAQELKNVYPQFVQMNSNGYYSVNYQEMIPLLAQGMKQQQQQIDDLKKEISDLKSMIKERQPVAMN